MTILDAALLWQLIAPRRNAGPPPPAGPCRFAAPLARAVVAVSALALLLVAG